MKQCLFNIYRLIFVAFVILLFASCNEKKKFEGYLYPIKENGLYGYIDSVGNRIIEPKFLWASPFTDGLAMVVVDTIYREVLDSVDFEVNARDTISKDYRMLVKYGYIDKTGKFAINPSLISYVSMPEDGFHISDLASCSNALSRHIFYSKRALYDDTTNWKNGYIDVNGVIVIKPQFYYSEPFSYGRAIVRRNVSAPIYYNDMCLNPSKLRCSYIDTLGNIKTIYNYEKLTKFNGRRGIGTYYEMLKDSLGNLDGFTVHNDIVDVNGEVIKDLGIWNRFYDYSRDGISIAKQVMHLQVYDGMYDSYSFVDEDGNYLQPLKGLTNYQIDSLNRCDDIIEVLQENAPIADVTYFNDGFAGITPDCERWFVIDKYLIIHGYGKESIFEDFRPFANGLAAVKRNGKWGYINKKIKEQIPCKYDSCGLAYPFLEEIFEYDIQGDISKIGYINRNDSLIWENKIPKVEEIKNKYSGKEKKNWGKWTYNGNTFQDNINIWNVMAFCFILFVILALWRTFSSETLKKQVEIEQNQIVSIDDNASRPLEDSSMIDDDLHIYPSVGQYTDIIKLAASSPDEYFEKLSNFHPVLDEHGDPIMSNGNFAVVYKMVDENGKFHAVRCFHRYQEGRRQSYKLICEELGKVSSPYLLPIQYMENELYVDSVEYPVLLMDWVDGITLDKYIRMIINDKAKLHSLANNFRQMAIWLLNQPFAHGDLKPDNILVKKDGSLVLVDYDGMYVPAMQGQKAREMGSPDYRNPSRNESVFDGNIDIFPIISILISLELIIEDKGIIDRYGEDDRLLFSEKDYRNINESRTYRIATVSYRHDVPELARLLKDLIDGEVVDKEKLTSLLKGDSFKKELYANDIIEKPMRIFYAIYTVGIFLLPFVMRSMRWSITEISISMLCANIGLLLLLNIIDLMRPSPQYHIHPEGEGGFGCLGMIAVCIPLLLMTDVVSEYMINRSQYLGFLNLPDYNDEWYITLLNWIIWYFSILLYSQSFTDLYEWRKKYYMTSKERVFEQKEKELEKLREELKKEEEQQMGKKSREQKRNTLCDDLPF